MTRTPRVAIVHDWLNQVGGAENVLEELHALYPDAPIHTSMYWRVCRDTQPLSVLCEGAGFADSIVP